MIIYLRLCITNTIKKKISSPYQQKCAGIGEAYNQTNDSENVPSKKISIL